jgi:hypothetical protein
VFLLWKCALQAAPEEWHKNKKGKWVGRGKGMYDARPMTADEKVKYGGLIKKADPTARF